MKKIVTFADKYRSFFIFIVVIAGFFVVMLDSTVVNVALASIGKNMHVSDSGLQWIINSYTLSMASTLLVCGSLCDRFGAHSVYTTGLIIFALASLECSMANKIVLLLVARIIQGIGGACLIPASLALISKLAASSKQRAHFIGWWGASGGFAAATGPLLGGLLTSQFGWQAIFYLNPPIIAILLICLWISWDTFKQQNELKNSRFDWLGSALITLVMIVCCFVASSWSVQSALSVTLLMSVGIAALATFVIHEKRSRQPLLPLKLAKQTHFIFANIVGFSLNFSFFGELFALTLYLQNQLGLSSIHTGFAVFPQTCSAIIAAPLGGRYASRWGNLRTMQVGLSIGCAGFTLMNLIDQNISFTLIASFSFLASFGMAFAVPAASNQAVSNADDSEQGIASGVINTVRQFGTMMGIAMIGSLYTLNGIHAALTTAALMFLLSLIIISVRKQQ